MTRRPRQLMDEPRPCSSTLSTMRSRSWKRMFTSIAVSERNTLLNIAIPFSAKACGHCCHFVCCRGTQIQGQHAARTNNQMRHVDWHVFNPAFAEIARRRNHITRPKSFCMCLDEPVQRCVFTASRTLDLHWAYLDPFSNTASITCSF